MTDTKSQQERIAAARAEAGERKRMGEQESFYRNFLSLSETIQMVANCIQISDDELDLVVLPDSELGDVAAFEARVAATSLKQLFRTSRAADILGLNIANTPAGHRLRWFDVTTGRGETYWQSAAARDEGLALLADMAKWESSAREAQRRQAMFNSSRWSAHEPASAPRFRDLPTTPRIRLIGFDPDELIDFLLTRQIPNTLVAALPFSEVRESAPAQIPTSAVSRAERPPKFRGPLAATLAMAWQIAHDRDSPHSMLHALVELAQRKPPPRPLHSATDDGQEVKWVNDEGEIQIFTIKDMQSRMRVIRKTNT
ncbi:hypothetical protein [Burkholderia thailandensis]|uniref:hypothetical protein n=2 Tax=Burkholderia thailandensis TaxID=57975 RepID=UPI00140AAE22|nr:hypothetical protein [Burkholderia thailandensis]MCS3399381.1 hypothetical protein [Burkholderia thailandensis]QIO11655.1 hypothetical protein G9462_06325 [Burkholderia thailandensis]